MMGHSNEASKPTKMTVSIFLFRFALLLLNLNLLPSPRSVPATGFDAAPPNVKLICHPYFLKSSADMATVVNMAGFGFPCHSPVRGVRRKAVIVRAEAGGVAVNPAIRKSEEKVVDSVVVAELSKPLTAYCRCWRSGTFPLCDGSHVKHNKATGDNVGPLLLKKQKE